MPTVTVPLPASPCVRVRLIYQLGGGLEAGNRFYLSYSGSAPDGTQCASLASSIAGLWATDLAPLTSSEGYLSEVDVLDIATDLGASGQWNGTHNGSRSGTPLPWQVATNVELNIAQRYRGGKPRIYLLPGTNSDLETESSWQSEYITAVNTGVGNFFAGIHALSITPFGTLDHVVLSYYKGYDTNRGKTTNRGTIYPPLYRSSALLFGVSGYSCKAELGTQKRRRSATSP